MVVLFTNIGLTRRTGTEVVVAELAQAIQARGHRPMVYSPSLGKVADEIAARGIPVVSSLDELPAVPDVIHGHHHIETIQAIQRFPKTPALFVCHDVHSWHDQVPHHPNITMLAAVGANARLRLVRDWPRGRAPIVTVGNGVDTTRFIPRDPLPARPRRALVFSNDAGDYSHWEPIHEACDHLGIEVERIGLATGRQVRYPEEVLPSYDLVFAKGRCALEACAVGTAVILCDTQGLGEMIRGQSVARLYHWNFGMKTLNRPVLAELVAAEIRRYSASDARNVRDYVRCNCTLASVAERYLALYRNMVMRGVPARPIARRDRRRHPQTSPVDVREQGGLQMVLLNAPREVAAGSGFELRIEVCNRTGMAIGTSPPWPALFFHRWFEEDSEDTLAIETPRGIIQPPLYPMQTRQYRVRAVAPRRAGKFRLRVTIMQEGWRFLDELHPQVYADHEIQLTPVTSLSARQPLPADRALLTTA